MGVRLRRVLRVLWRLWSPCFGWGCLPLGLRLRHVLRVLWQLWCPCFL